jgi:hypothetical protein
MRRTRSLALIRITLLTAGLTAAGRASVHASQWVDQRTVDVFEVRSEFSLGDDTGRALLEEILRLREEIETILRLEAAPEPIEVNLFASRRSYQEFLKIRIPEGASRSALYVKGTDRGRVYVYRHPGFDVDLRHECTHAILHNALPFVPLWLDEGLAEYFEVPAPLRGRGHPHLRTIQQGLAVGWSPALSGLESRHELRDMSPGDYRDSWAWVHFLLYGPDLARQELSNFLYDIRIGNPPGQLSERLAVSLPGTQQALIRHFRSLK